MKIVEEYLKFLEVETEVLDYSEDTTRKMTTMLKKKRVMMGRMKIKKKLRNRRLVMRWIWEWLP